MARHIVTKEVRELAQITGKTEAEVTAKYTYKVRLSDGEWEACNRGTQSSIKRELAEAQARARKAEEKKAFAQKMQAGAAIWRKVGIEWLVQVTGREVEAGEMIEVERRDGSKSLHLIRSIVTQNDNGIFCRV